MRISKIFPVKLLLYVVLSFTFIGFTLLPAVNANQPVERPYQIAGQMTFLDIGGNMPWTCIDSGVGTGHGKFVSVGKYVAPNYGFGILYAANGDQLFWKDQGVGIVEFTGGTGHFEGATGSFTLNISSIEYVPGPEGTVSWVLTYTGEGTITY